MGLRIASNLTAAKVQGNINKNNRKTDKALEQLSSGKRIIHASDDSAGMAIAKTMEAQTRGMRQAGRNASNAISLIQTAEGSMTESSNLMVRLRELAIQAASDTVGDLERGMLDLEYKQLVKEIDRIAENTVFNGVSLINGEGKDLYTFHVGPNHDESNIIQYDASGINTTSSKLGVSGTGISEKSEALSSVESIDEGLENLSGQRSVLGAIQNRLQSALVTIDIAATQQEDARATIEDVDVAKAATDLAVGKMQQNTAVAALAQANALPRAALDLV